MNFKLFCISTERTFFCTIGRWMPEMLRKLTLHTWNSALAELSNYDDFFNTRSGFLFVYQTNVECMFGQRYRVIDLVYEQHVICYSVISVHPKSDKHKLDKA